MQVALENHRRWKSRRGVVDAAVTAHLLGVDCSFVFKKNSIDGFSRTVQCFCHTANWLRQEMFLGETAVYRSSLWSADSHLVSPFAVTGNLKLLPSGTVGSERPDWSVLNVTHKQLVKSLSKCFSLHILCVFFFLHSKLFQSSLYPIFSISATNAAEWGNVPSGTLRTG